MKAEHDKHWDAELDAELKNLPELSAPGTLVPRVMAAIRARTETPHRWYRQAWPMWPVPVRFASLLLLLACFGGLCFVGVKISQADRVTAATYTMSEWISGCNAIWTMLKTLAETAVLVAKQLGPIFVFACLTIAALTYFTFIGLGTAFVRFAFIRQQN